MLRTQPNGSFSSSTFKLLPCIALTAGLMASGSASACHKRPACNIPDNIYKLTGVIEDDRHISLTLTTIHGRPILRINDASQKKEYTVVPNRPHHKRPHGQPLMDSRNTALPDADCEKEHQDFDGFVLNNGNAAAFQFAGPPHHNRPHHRPFRPNGQQGRPHQPPACINETLSFKWTNQSSVPGVLSGEIKLTYQNNALTGKIVINGDNISVQDNSITLQAQ
ncbi:hypothetical protein [Parendozoicomonas haliclonae]|uniref:Uncharacterized protein n=1 Tax=Parendozoicomonas haliclonae TaxID=1960125 RepID=A0A1X7AMN1_9GAMM|nr:hypothetical protein [Parendozoicomonas haliclonae]SMA49534.1 hypothetical protein EHSB41UT_03326 [Parendozoicomonas haliclonae]